MWLAIHVMGAGVTGVMMTVAVISLLGKKGRIHGWLAKGIGLGAIFQMVSGLFLAVGVSGGLKAYCIKMGIYLTGVGIVEALLFTKIMVPPKLERKQRPEFGAEILTK